MMLMEVFKIRFHLSSAGLGVGHEATGIYANSKVLPFEKRYFSGGANSVRGWSIRNLGPGSYRGSEDGRMDFIK